MKIKIFLILLVSTAFGLFLNSCEEPVSSRFIEKPMLIGVGDDENEETTYECTSTTAEGTFYKVCLTKESDGNGNWIYTWSVTNTYPNGKNGQKDLSHFNVIFIDCLLDDINSGETNIISAQFKYGDNSSYTTINPTPTYKIDPSTQSTYNGSVFKFDYGTSGSVTTYYRLILDKNYNLSTGSAVFKYGRTATKSNNIPTIGC
jgi:hypothetical protein